MKSDAATTGGSGADDALNGAESAGLVDSSKDLSHRYTPPSLGTSPSATGDITRKILYTASLFGALIIIQGGSNSNSSVWGVVQQHEPSSRIFRALLEIVLLLLCTAASIAIWSRYVGCPTTARLLFAPVQAKPVTRTAAATTIGSNELSDDVNDEESEAAFQDIHEKDIFEPNDDAEEIENSGTKTYSEYMSNEYDEAMWIPSPWCIVGAALDLLIWTLVALVLYTIAATEAIHFTPFSLPQDNDQQQQQQNNNASNSNVHWLRFVARMAAPTFPLLLFTGAVVKAVYPWKARASFYTILSYTLWAPSYEVTFRDGMIGDVLTSMVRPMQDIAFTLSYIVFGLQGWWANGYFSPTSIAAMDGSHSDAASSNAFLNAADASVPAMERSWLLHTAILPACMISPLWWRFLQNMRQTYDAKQRWPYLGNALKYFAAAQVAMVGVYQPHMQQNTLWLLSFVGATLYQIYWDIFLDWGLLVRDPQSRAWGLRDQRLYPRKSLYWTLIVVNTLLRFCWTLSFVPLHYLSAAGVLTSNFSNSTWTSILAPTIASAEIIRRTFWGLLRVEWEAIKTRGEGHGGKNQAAEEEDGFEMKPMSIESSTRSIVSFERLGLPSFTSDMSQMSNVQIVRELSMYTTAFAVLGLVIAAHRGTL